VLGHDDVEEFWKTVETSLAGERIRMRPAGTTAWSDPWGQVPAGINCQDRR